jgi:hypothetical protein
MAKAKSSKKAVKAAAKVAAKGKGAVKAAAAKKGAAAQAAAAPAPVKVAPAPAAKRDPRLPAPGTVLTGRYKGAEYKAKVLDHGFLYDGRQYKSLSAIGKEITKAATNGFAFFKLLTPEQA